MILEPGESSDLQSSVFMMHPGMDGPHDDAVHLKTNDPENPDLVVHVLSNWGPWPENEISGVSSHTRLLVLLRPTSSERPRLPELCTATLQQPYETR